MIASRAHSTQNVLNSAVPLLFVATPGPPLPKHVARHVSQDVEPTSHEALYPRRLVSWFLGGVKKLSARECARDVSSIYISGNQDIDVELQRVRQILWARLPT